MTRYAIATQIDLSGGKRIWVPPRGRPFWAHTSPRAIDLTDKEIKEYLPPNFEFEDFELEMKWRGK